VDLVNHPKYAVKAANQGTSWMQDTNTANGLLRRTNWNAVNWRQAERNVRNLRQRIFRATQANDLRRVRSLQKLMLRSYSNILMSVRRVTQVNAGKYTPGVDKLVVKTPAARGQVVDFLATYQPWRACPVRRVYIPKASDGTKLRPLGIPTVIDRCMQARVKNALEPEWEARFEGTSYGFRPGRGCHDAIGAVYNLGRPNKRKKWVVDADIKGAFDNINQEFLLRTLGGVPGRELIRQWLQAGIMEDGAFHETPAGTPQGGVISPLLLNVALHGMEAALGVIRGFRGKIVGKRAVVRYADDFVVFCESKEDAERVKDVLLPPWLAERGLSLSPEKTRIVHLTEGFDFLGFNVRHYEAPKTSKSGYKLLIRPSKKAVVAKRKDLRDAWLRLKGQNVIAVLRALNPIIRGWANYHRRVVASETFREMDNWMLYRAKRYARFTHPTKPWKWRKARYWGKLNKERKDNWVFGDKQSGSYLLKFSWFKIVRHELVRGAASPDDPSLRDYWWERGKVNALHLIPSDKKMAVAQDWRCRLCGMALMNGEELHRHHKNPRTMGGTDAYSNRELVHLYCHQQETCRQFPRGTRAKPDDEQTIDVS
jgi:RNA-directed DNA polymerase